MSDDYYMAPRYIPPEFFDGDAVVDHEGLASFVRSLTVRTVSRLQLTKGFVFNPDTTEASIKHRVLDGLDYYILELKFKKEDNNGEEAEAE